MLRWERSLDLAVGTMDLVVGTIPMMKVLPGADRLVPWNYSVLRLVFGNLAPSRDSQYDSNNSSTPPVGWLRGTPEEAVHQTNSPVGKPAYPRSTDSYAAIDVGRAEPRDPAAGGLLPARFARHYRNSS